MKQELPLVQTHNYTTREYTTNLFIKQNVELPFTFTHVLRYKNQNFLTKLKEIVSYEILKSSTFYKEGRLTEHREALLKVQDNFYIQIEHLDTPMTEYSFLIRKKKNYDDSIIESVTLFYSKSTSQSQIEKVKKFLLFLTPLKVETKNLINIVITQHGELCLREFEIKRPKLNLDYNYNDDFLPIHNTIVEAINKKDADGLVLLHSTPGCGKTNYIKFLISKIKKKVIYLPPNLANEISSPSFINFLAENQNSVLIIEDAENVLKSRQNGENQGVSNLLNVSNGLLSDILKVQIIATFNCDIHEIDPALLRQGRLIAKYKFSNLTIEKAQRLSDKLSFKTKIESEMNLAEIYNQNKQDFREQKRNKIGF